MSIISIIYNLISRNNNQRQLDDYMRAELWRIYWERIEQRNSNAPGAYDFLLPKDNPFYRPIGEDHSGSRIQRSLDVE